MSPHSQASVILAPPFTRETAILRVRAIEDIWNSRNLEKVAHSYSNDCYWRKVSEFLSVFTIIQDLSTWACEVTQQIQQEEFSR